MLSVDFNKRIGYYNLKSLNKKYRIDICHANALCAMIHFHKDEDGEDQATLQMFFGDYIHAERCIKTDIFHDCSGFVFYAKELSKDMWKVIQLMTKQGIEVTIK